MTVCGYTCRATLTHYPDSDPTILCVVQTNVPKYSSYYFNKSIPLPYVLKSQYNAPPR